MRETPATDSDYGLNVIVFCRIKTSDEIIAIIHIALCKLWLLISDNMYPFKSNLFSPKKTIKIFFFIKTRLDMDWISLSFGSNRFCLKQAMFSSLALVMNKVDSSVFNASWFGGFGAKLLKAISKLLTVEAQTCWHAFTWWICL